MAKGQPKRGRKVSQPSLGELIRTQREALGLSQNALAKQSGIDVAYISRIESGEIAQPSAPRLARLADELGLGLTETYAAAAQRPESELLPSFTPYLRTKYGELPEEAQERMGRYFARVSKQHGLDFSGPADGEDEIDE